MAKVLYTAEATVTGGRDVGQGRTSDGELEVDIRAPKELGGPGGGTNPEQLFAVGYASCFESAMKLVARRMKTDADDVSIDSKVHLAAGENRSMKIAAELWVTLASDQAMDIVKAAHRVCPYSMATAGNIDVGIWVNGEPVEGTQTEAFATTA